MENSLKFWKAKEWLTIHEIAHLVIGSDPTERAEEPAGWRAIYDALGLNLEEYHKIKGSNEIFPKDPDSFNGIFTEVNIRKNDGEGANFSPYLIKQSVIPEWLNSIGLESDYFACLVGNVKAEVMARPEYQTELMRIMYKTIERYYGENYVPDDRDSWPKQVNVIGWLEVTYSLSGAKAKAVEKMIRPD